MSRIDTVVITSWCVTLAVVFGIRLAVAPPMTSAEVVGWMALSLLLPVALHIFQRTFETTTAPVDPRADDRRRR